MDAVCEECGDAGVRELLVRCSKCKNAARHRYCLDKVIFDSVVEWSCSGCIPKHNEAIESLGDASNQRQLSSTELGCSMIKDPTMDSWKRTKARGLRTIRPQQKRKDHVDGSTKHFLGGCTSSWGQWRNELHKETQDSSDAITTQICSRDALDSCEVFIQDIPNNDDYEKEGEDRNGHLACTDSSSSLPLDHASESEPNNLENSVDGSKLALDSMKCTDLSNAGSSCFASSKYVEGLARRGRKGDIFALTNDVGSLPMIVEKSHPTPASVEQAGLSINMEKSEPLKAVIGLEMSAVAFALTNDEGSLPMIVEKSHPTPASVEQAGLSINMEKSEPLKAVGLEKSAVASKFAPNCSKPIQGSDLKTGSADVLNPLQNCLDSCSMVSMQSSPYNKLEDVAVQENSAERTRCLVDEETNAATMRNLKVSRPSVANECFVSNEDNSDKAKRRSDEVSLSTKAKKRRTRMSGDREIVHSYKVNVISNPKSAKGDRGARKNLQRNAGKPSSVDVKKVVLQEEGINSELLSSFFVGPCESTKINSRKRKQSESSTPDGTKYQKAAIVNEIKIGNDAQSKGGRPAPAASVRESHNMPREGDGSGNLNHRGSKNHKEAKKSMDANKDGNVSIRNPSAGCAESDVSQLTLQTVIKEACSGISRIPPISECVDVQPLDKPYWTGIMKIDGNYIPLAAHLSTKAGKKIQEQSRSLPPIIKVTELSTSKTCPKHLETPILSADSIGLYFFSSDMRPNEELDQLVKHAADSGIILEALVGSAKLFLFPSFVLPERYQRFQGKPFLWGAFKPRKEKIKRLAQVKQDCAARVTKEDHVEEQHVLDQQDKSQGDTLDLVVHPENQPLLDVNREVGEEVLSGNGLPLVDMKAIVSANITAVYQGQPCSNPEATPHKICGFVLSRTPKSAQLIQELQKEGALFFPVQQLVTEPGSVV